MQGSAGNVGVAKNNMSGKTIRPLQNSIDQTYNSYVSLLNLD